MEIEKLLFFIKIVVRSNLNLRYNRSRYLGEYLT